MTFNPRDLHIDIRAATGPQKVRNGGPQNAIFPGWFLTVHKNEGYDLIIPPRQLPVFKVETIAMLIDRSIGDFENYKILSEVRKCQTSMREELKRQLDIAEKAALKITELKKLLGES